MSESTFNFKAAVGQIITGDISINGDNIGIQNNCPEANQELIELANQLENIIKNIQGQMNLDPIKQADQIITVQVAQQEIEQQTNLRGRLVAAIKAGTFETIKQLTQHPLVQILLEAFKAGIEI
ncbi:MAG: hypothetical protein IM585_03375 [Pseudanabaena sp. M135S2SP2A07QC]|jgi:hypothetical protein|nr:hypothetical protein [Pseudanabaena sp. M090S1SP2A07QC]MCA6524132.1 hypothetical protein [Pseudanabaena sp. M051S1SP2A07QC]MCA6526867.1 hypothetical protein [Pseudanabaena sp. M179S2SP2A07QC]MCA6531832.1 hypothetical protein [Pseudanabaena sp. M125S2SP2A07QC]MCA6535539.1 hypothetical protein [Pseudanabaena sp. M176S2SP2A07QC]MCA6540733.1 hypothetical protein [Pseudanabaena sp. M037S2SP2A07QC]MCA6544890.1 hypothetical protein [Pseudanabaena sp. M074S1SP2A07QC]MCA6546499.1 hypothetical prot